MLRPMTGPRKPLQPETAAPLKRRAVAVALTANSADPEAPARISATGRGKLAEEILAIAFAKGVKVREDADLAELLVQLDLDTPIPSEAISAVAEILAKVYEANQALLKKDEPPLSPLHP